MQWFWLLAPALSLATAQVVKLDIQKHSVLPHRAEGVQKSTLTRRNGVVNEELTNIITFGYMASVYIGNPPQLISLLIDTGSSDTYVPSADSGQCSGLQDCGCMYMVPNS